MVSIKHYCIIIILLIKLRRRIGWPFPLWVQVQRYPWVPWQFFFPSKRGIIFKVKIVCNSCQLHKWYFALLFLQIFPNDSSFQINCIFILFQHSSQAKAPHQHWKLEFQEKIILKSSILNIKLYIRSSKKNKIITFYITLSLLLIDVLNLRIFVKEY